MLTGTQLARLMFAPGAGVSNTSSTLQFSVTDTAGNTSLGAATLAVGALAGGGAGDVHIVTLDGLRYDFQAIGDFVAARTVADGADDGFAVQMRAAEWDDRPGTSLAMELGARVGQDVVRFGIGGTPVTVNGLGIPGLGGVSNTVQLGDGLLTQTGADRWVLGWNTGESLSVTDNGFYLDFAITEGSHDTPGLLQGLLGSDTGPATDFELPDGLVLAQPLSESAILGTFADAWRVGAGQSLLEPSSLGSMSAPSAPIAASFAAIALQAISPTYQMTFAHTPGQICSGGLGGTGPVEILGRSAVLAGDAFANLGPGDLIDITDLNGSTGWTAETGGVIQAGDSDRSVSIRMVGVWPQFQFATTSDPNGGLLVHIG